MSDGESGASRHGITGSVRRLLESLAGFLATKLDLVSVELQEEKRRILDLLVLAAAALLFGALSLTILVFVVATFFLKSLPAALLTICGLYGLIAIFLFARLRRKASLSNKIFETTVEELKKDREWVQRHL